MSSNSKTIPERSDASAHPQQGGTSDNSVKDDPARGVKAVEAASSLSSVIGVIRRLRRGRWTLTEVHR